MLIVLEVSKDNGVMSDRKCPVRCWTAEGRKEFCDVISKQPNNLWACTSAYTLLKYPMTSLLVFYQGKYVQVQGIPSHVQLYWDWKNSCYTDVVITKYSAYVEFLRTSNVFVRVYSDLQEAVAAYKDETQWETIPCGMVARSLLGFRIQQLTKEENTAEETTES